MKSVVVVAGTRPEIIKMTPIIRALNKTKMPFRFVHCGQHNDYNMEQKFIEELELPTQCILAQKRDFKKIICLPRCKH